MEFRSRELLRASSLMCTVRSRRGFTDTRESTFRRVVIVILSQLYPTKKYVVWRTGPVTEFTWPRADFLKKWDAQREKGSEVLGHSRTNRPKIVMSRYRPFFNGQ